MVFPHREKWDGPRLGPLDAVELLGMDEVPDESCDPLCMSCDSDVTIL